MLVAKRFRVVIAGGALVALAACVTTRSDLVTNADRLEHNAHLMAQDVREDSDYPSGFVHDAHILADDSRQFRHVVEEHGASNGDVKVAFERVSRDYHAVRDDAEHSDSPRVRDDLKPVTEAYLDLERTMGGYPETRLSSER